MFFPTGVTIGIVSDNQMAIEPDWLPPMIA